MAPSAVPDTNGLMTRTDYRKIDIYVGGYYSASTTWARTLAEAKARFMTHPEVATTSAEAGPHKRRVQTHAKAVVAVWARP